MGKLPEGYIAPNYGSHTFAVDSAALAKNGEVHMNNGVDARLARPVANISYLFTGYYANTTLDSFVELDIKNDPRLEEIKKYAHEIGNKYADPKSPDYISNAQSREKTSTDLLNA